VTREEAWEKISDSEEVTEEIAEALETPKMCTGMTREEIENMLGIKLEED